MNPGHVTNPCREEPIVYLEVYKIKNSMDKKLAVLVLSILIAGIVAFWFQSKINRSEFLRLPKIRKELSLDTIEVSKISFERNGLIINGRQYNAGGISSYSNVNFNDMTLKLEDIKTPFILTKRKNNDTLEIIKGDDKMYILISDELRFDTLK